jgi:transposase-like protein/IS1 family transposase
MTCHNCQIDCNRFGKHRNGLQRFRCSQCRKTFTEDRQKPLDEMRIPLDKATMVLKLLVEGTSVRSIERVTQVHRDTIIRLLILAGERCSRLLDEKMRGLKCNFIECDEIWTFCFKKQRRVRKADPAEFGDQWVFVALDAETKLVPSFCIGKRSAATTATFIDDLSQRIENRAQITTDGFRFYVNAIERSFGADVDFAQLVKLYGDYGQHDHAAKYSPSPIVEVISKVRQGEPDADHISTSYVERQNLTMRMQMRRFTRLTNAFSKKLENLKAAIALHFAYYNFCRVHKTLRVTPCMEAKVTDHVWSVAELLGQQPQLLSC